MSKFAIFWAVLGNIEGLKSQALLDFCSVWRQILLVAAVCYIFFAQMVEKPSTVWANESSFLKVVRSCKLRLFLVFM